jgi:hypothetical protein
MARKRRRRRQSRSRPAPAAAAAAPRAKPDKRRMSKDEIAREQLEPLREGERPLAVTIAAIVAAAIAVSNVIGWIAGLEVSGESFSAGQVLPPAIVMLVAAVGMWYSRYWAVLGFQAILAILIVIVSIALTTASNVLAVVVSLAIIGAAGALFWFLVKALARIQMPERRRPEPNR